MTGERQRVERRLQPSDNAPVRRTIVFGRHALDTRARVLTWDGRRVELQQQPFELLLLLVEHVDAVVTREMMRERIWPDAVVDYDQSINYAIRHLRQALGTDADRVRTVPRRGYRFVGPLDATAPRRLSGATAAALTVAVIFSFGIGIVAAHTNAGAFIFEHIAHPYSCPYIQVFFAGL